MATYASKGNRLEDGTVPPKAIGTIGAASVGAANSGAGLSSFWQDCPLQAALIDPSVGYGMQDDFVDAGLSPTITTIISGQGRYLLFGSAGATIAPDAAVGGGLVLSEATDNESVSITTKQTPFQIEATKGSLWFEARVKTSTVTTAEQAWIVGLRDSTPQTATVPITATGAIADINMVGFHHPEANTTAFDASYKADGVTAVEVNSNIGTLAAGTYIKLGMKFDTSNNVLSFYVNGVRQTTGKTIPTSAGTDFPADVTLAPVVAMTLANSAAETITIDWIKCFQAR
jgi:hypothetical protein